MTKRVRVTAALPDLAAAHHHQEATGEGGSVKVALKSAVDKIFSGQHVKGRQVKGGTFRWIVEENGKGDDGADGE